MPAFPSISGSITSPSSAAASELGARVAQAPAEPQAVQAPAEPQAAPAPAVPRAAVEANLTPRSTRALPTAAASRGPSGYLASVGRAAEMGAIALLCDGAPMITLSVVVAIMYKNLGVSNADI